jgi:hypothetical protein
MSGLNRTAKELEKHPFTCLGSDSLQAKHLIAFVNRPYRPSSARLFLGPVCLRFHRRAAQKNI